MTYFWMWVNELTLGEVGDENGGWTSLQWLVIFWMCHRKMVPSPREIQGRGNHKVMRDGGTGVDLGWVEDEDFVKEWMETKQEFKWSHDMTLKLLEGFRDFLEFCGWLESSGGTWILNTRTGELIKMKDFLKSNAKDWNKNMSETEMSLLRNQVVNFKDSRIYLTHPLNLQWKLGLRSDIDIALKLMRRGAVRLKKYVNLRQFNGAKEARKTFKCLKDVFKVNYVESNETG